LALLLALAPPGAAEEERGSFCVRAAAALSIEPLPASSIPVRASIGNVDVHVLDVFEPSNDGDDPLVHRVANRLHVNTRPRVIERELLFTSGDLYDSRALQESERRLRQHNAIYDACIVPVRVRGGVVDVAVLTRDVWTLSGGAGISRSGEANTIRFGVEDVNFLGSGRLLDLQYTDDPDRTEHRFRFQDPALLGTRAELALMIADRSDGYRNTLDVVRPFFSFDTRWSAGGRLVSHFGEVKLYSRGEVSDRFDMDQRFLEVRGGISRGWNGGGAHRLLAGFTWDEREFLSCSRTTAVTRPSAGADVRECTAPTVIAPVEPVPRERAPHRPPPSDVFDPVPSLPGGPPAPRTVSYPWIGYQWVEDGFVERRNLDLLARTEDWNFGTELNVRVGWSSPSWGADESQAVAAIDWSRGIATPRGRHIVLFDAGAGGRFGGDESENVLAGARMRHFFSNFGRHQLVSSVQFDAARNLDPENQLLLGGDNGLRGYPMRFRDGDRRALVSVEQRFYSNVEVLKLFHLGAAAFVDVGRAWYSGVVPNEADEVLRDIGVGLRLGSSRSAKGTMVHLDVAFPIDGDRSERRGVQWLVRTRDTF
jgi:hypothetical protein